MMSPVKWAPVADETLKRGGHFIAGQEYIGVPHSSAKHVGRHIGFDISLNTFLAAIDPHQSVMHPENLYGKMSNAEYYYDNVCSSYTSNSLQCGISYVNKVHGPKSREGVTIVVFAFARRTPPMPLQWRKTPQKWRVRTCSAE